MSRTKGTIISEINVHLTSLVVLCVFTAFPVGTVIASLRYPVAFEECSPGVLREVYESYRLQMNLQEKPNAPMAFEAEHASAIDLHGAERLAFRDDATGGVAVQQARALTFNFTTLSSATYSVWFRCKPHPGSAQICGPLGYGLSISNGERVPPVIQGINQPCKAGEWTWVKVGEHKLYAGEHSMSVSANLVIYGDAIDRVVLSRDPDFTPTPTGNDIGPVETATTAVESGTAVSPVVKSVGVKQWKKVSYRQALCGGKVSWAYKLEGTTDWQDVSADNLSVIPPDKPFRLKMTLMASEDKKTPLVDTVRLEYDGAPLKKELVSGVIYEANSDGGCVVSSPLYRVTFAANGRIESLIANGRELMVTGSEEQQGCWLQWTSYPKGEISQISLGAPDLTSDNKIARRTNETTQLFEFKKNSITILLSSFGGTALSGMGSLTHVFQINPALDIATIMEEETGKVIPSGMPVTKTPRIVFKDSSSVTINPVSQFLPATITYANKKAFVSWGDNVANYNTIGMTFHPKPGTSLPLAGNVACQHEDHNFPSGKPIRITTSSMIPFDASSFRGSATLTLTEQYVTPRRKPEVFEKTVALDVTSKDAKKPVEWIATLKTPGHYRGEYRLKQNGKVVNSDWFYILYGAEVDKAHDKPKDYDSFWKNAMDKLAILPPVFERLTQSEQGTFIQSRITFKTIDNRDAWGQLVEPKEDGMYPAILCLPAVFTGGGAQMKEGFVSLGCDVFGFDPTKLDWLGNEAREIYQPWQNWQNKAVKRPEEFWLYYAYCTIARAYDLLEHYPKVDKNRIYITGVSQGGGLTLAVAGLRPQNAGALSIVPGICRIAWASPSEGCGAWGPTFIDGPDYADMARMAQYFETAYLMPKIRSRLVMFIGLLDDHTPPFAAATVFHHLSPELRERKLIVDPWMGHGGRSDLNTYIPHWAEEDKKGVK